MSRCRTNFHSENEANINKQINMELYASYVYLSMVSSVYYSYIFLKKTHDSNRSIWKSTSWHNFVKCSMKITNFVILSFCISILLFQEQ